MRNFLLASLAEKHHRSRARTVTIPRRNDCGWGIYRITLMGIEDAWGHSTPSERLEVGDPVSLKVLSESRARIVPTDAFLNKV